MTTATVIEEGWGKRVQGDRATHWYRDGMSVCGDVPLYVGQVDPDADPGRAGHAACRRALAAGPAKGGGKP